MSPLTSTLDSFRIFLHSLNGMPLGLYKGIVSGFWNTLEIPTGCMSPQCIATETTPTYIWTNQPQKGDASLLEAMSHTPIDSATPASLGLCNSLSEAIHL